jgi:hypothetical protein
MNWLAPTFWFTAIQAGATSGSSKPRLLEAGTCAASPEGMDLVAITDHDTLDGALGYSTICPAPGT